MMDGIGDFDAVGRDFHHSIRRLLKRPTFTFAAVFTLALGIGATTAIFSVVYSVLIKPLPYPNDAELVALGHNVEGNPGGFEPTMYLTYRDESRAFSNVGLWQYGSVTLTGRGEPERARALRVTDGTLQALGVQPMRGRWFNEHEYGAEGQAAPPVILSHAFWQGRFGADESVLGSQLSIDSQTLQVVGIMPPGFNFLDLTPQPDLILTAGLAPAAEQTITGALSFQGLARLAPGFTPDEVYTDAARMLEIWKEAWPLPPPELGITRDVIANLRISPIIQPLRDSLVGDVASLLWLLMGAIGAVLLIACANIANLMLVRADERRREFAVRAALGAVPARIARELLVESFVIAAVGGTIGLLFAYSGLRLLVANGPGDLPRLAEIAIYPPVLMFTVVVSLASTLLFGSITSLKHARHVDTARTLAVRGTSASRERGATRNALVVAQVALALVLTVSSALMIRTFQALRDVDPGFTNAATIQTMRIWIPTALYPDARQFTAMQRQMLDRITALPGVASAGFSSLLPMEGTQAITPILVEGQTLSTEGVPPTRGNKFISPGYLEAMGTRIVAGRDITWADVAAGGNVALISEEFARVIASDPAGAVGMRIRTFFETDAWREVVGVVQSVHEMGLYQDAQSFVYFPVLVENMYGNAVLGTPGATFAIRSERAGTASLVQEIRQAVWAVNGDVPINSERTMERVYSGSLARTSFALAMLAVAGGMALLLGIIGIYGVVTYVVLQRSREIGIRSALGAKPGQLRRMFLQHGLVLCGVGVAVGLVVAVALRQAMSSLLFGIGPMDFTSYTMAVIVVVVAAAAASYVPARRAAAISPMDTLRTE